MKKTQIILLISSLGIGFSALFLNEKTADVKVLENVKNLDFV